jgi:hypothetical protein
MDGPTKICPRCRKEKPVDATNLKFKCICDGFSTACLKCLNQIQVAQTAARTKKEKGNKENPAQAGSTDDEEDDEFTFRNIHNSNLSEIDIESFLETISATEDIHSFGAFVNVSPIMKENLRECADSDALAELVWRRLKYRFMYTLASDSLMFLH